MIDMAVTQKYIGIDLPGPGQRMPERPQTRAGIEDEDPIPAADFDAGRIAAIARNLASRARNAPSDPPKANGQIGHRRLPVSQSDAAALARPSVSGYLQLSTSLSS
jgi:hypothetical protein